MAYVPKIFADHSAEFASRRLLTAVVGQANTYDVSRAEGTIFVVGDKPDATNLNAEFGKIKTETDSIRTAIAETTTEFTPTTGTEVNDACFYHVSGKKVLFNFDVLATISGGFAFTLFTLPVGLVPFKAQRKPCNFLIGGAISSAGYVSISTARVVTLVCVSNATNAWGQIEIILA